MVKKRRPSSLKRTTDSSWQGRRQPVEKGAVVKNWGGRLPIALTFPNSYYVGMSSLAFQLLYRWLNAEQDVVCERIFWQKGAAAAGQPLLSLENGRPADDFDIWAFTVSWEMDYFNVVEMLRQAGIPPLAQDRLQGSRWDGSPWPLIIAGGPGITMNPEPMAPFFDAVLIGEGEEAVPQFIDICRDALHEGPRSAPADTRSNARFLRPSSSPFESRSRRFSPG